VKIAVLGAGHMGGALVKGLLAAGQARPRDLWVTDVAADRRRALSKRTGVRAGADNCAATAWADVVVLCVKPQGMGDLLREIRGAAGPKHTVVSVAAGVKTATIEKILGRVPVIRAMPNTPALLRAGALVYCRGTHAGPKNEAAAKRLLSALGPVWKTNEARMDAVTALSGSGPAYVFLLAEVMAAAGAALGLPASMAEALARQTIYGAGRMLVETPDAPTELRRRVTSPGGTTEAALNVLMRGDLAGLFKKALADAARRSKDLSMM